MPVCVCTCMPEAVFKYTWLLPFPCIKVKKKQASKKQGRESLSQLASDSTSIIYLFTTLLTLLPSKYTTTIVILLYQFTPLLLSPSIAHKDARVLPFLRYLNPPLRVDEGSTRREGTQSRFTYDGTITTRSRDHTLRIS